MYYILIEYKIWSPYTTKPIIDTCPFLVKLLANANHIPRHLGSKEYFYIHLHTYKYILESYTNHVDHFLDFFDPPPFVDSFTK